MNINILIPTHSSTETSLTTEENEQKESLNKLYQEIEGLSIKNPKARFALDKLCQEIKAENLIHVLNHTNTLEERKIRLQTFVAIGEHFPRTKLFGLKCKKVYQGKTRNHTHAFAISSDNDIFLNLNFLDSGSQKKVSKAIKLNDLQPMVRIKAQGASRHFKAVKTEKKLLDYLHSKHVSNLMSSYSFQYEEHSVIGLKDPKIVLFQECYSMNGQELVNAPLVNQLTVLGDIATALDSLHRIGYVHGDFKPANFLIKEKSEGIPEGKLADFGGCIKKGKKLKVGSKAYLPPEALYLENKKVKIKNISASDKLDSFALGATILRVLSLYSHFDEKYIGIWSKEAIDKHIDKSKEIIINNHSLSEEERLTKFILLDLVKQLLETNPTQRLTCADASQKIKELIKAL